MVLAFEKKQVNGTETYPMNKPTHWFTKWIYSKDQFIYKKGVRAYTRKTAVSSINCIGKTGQAHVKEWNLTTILCYTQK